MHFHNSPRRTCQISAPSAVAGFTLVELMVSISIIVLVTSVVLVRQSAFNGVVLLRNQTYEVAFALRQAQLLAVSGNNEGMTGVQRYGVTFTKTAGANQVYQVFHDGDNDKIFDTGEEIGPKGRLDKRFEISDFTSTAGVTNGESTINVYFERPNFDAIVSNGNGTIVSGTVNIDIARVGTTGTTSGERRRVEVNRSGQIQVTIYP